MFGVMTQLNVSIYYHSFEGERNDEELESLDSCWISSFSSIITTFTQEVMDSEKTNNVCIIFNV